MAVTTRRTLGAKTNVYWTKDTVDKENDIVKVHVPGVNMEPLLDIKKPMVRKPVKSKRPDTMALQNRYRIESLRSLKTQKAQSITENKKEKDVDERPVKDTCISNSKEDMQAPKVTLKDLRPEDKKRVANLVNELAKVGEERELALSQLTEERMAFEERLQILQEEYESNINEKLNLQKRFLELQELLKKYKEEERSKVKKDKESQSINTTQTSPTTNLSGKQTQKPLELEEIPGNSRTISQRKNSNTNKSPKQSTPVASTCLIPESTKDEIASNQTPDSNTIIETCTTRPQDKIMISALTREISSGSKAEKLHHEKMRQKESPSKQSPVIRKVVCLHQKHGQNTTAAADLPLVAGQQSIKDMSSTQGFHERSQTGKSQTHLPLPKSTDQDPPVYTNKMFDISVSRPNPGWTFAAQMPERNNRSQTDTSLSFSVELDAVYRLYCREYELQLQLQQQQLELQKQQLQLQQQLQQLELFQQRQHTQHTVAVPPQPSNTAKPIIRETPIPTPAPQPSTHPRQESPLDGLVPTPDDKELDQHHSFERVEGNVQNDNLPTIRRITSSKRLQRNKVSSLRGGSYQDYHDGSLNQDHFDQVNSDSKQHAHWLTGSVNKQIIHPEEAAKLKFSLNRDRYRPSVKNSTDWSTVSDLEFRRMQENRIREHYGLAQYPLHSTQSSLPFSGAVSSRASYDLYERSSILDNCSEINRREIDGMIYAGQQLDRNEPSRVRYGLHETSRLGKEPSAKESRGEMNFSNKQLSGRDSHSCDVDKKAQDTKETFERDGRELDEIIYSGQQPQNKHPDCVSRKKKQMINVGRPGQRLPQDQTALKQHYSLYNSRDHHGYDYDNDDIVDPWVSRSSSIQRDRLLTEQPPELTYPLQIVDLVHEMEGEPSITSPSRKANYAVYSKSPSLQETAVLDGMLDSTDSGYSQVSRGVYEHKNSEPLSFHSDNEEDNEELNVLEDIFFI